jgi:hypothetical protein
VPDAAYYREQAARAQRLLTDSTDQLTRERLTVLAAEYLTKAQALDIGPAGSRPETM